VPTATYRALYALAEQQTGLVTTAQAARVGVQPMTLVMMRKRGTVSRVSRGVYRLVEFPVLPLSRYVAATLWPYELQGVLSHQTALALHELFDAPPSDVHITVPAGFRIQRRIPSELVVHRVELTEMEIGRLDCVPITTPERTIRDCIESGFEPSAVFKSIESGLRTGILDAGMAAKLRRQLLKATNPAGSAAVGSRVTAASLSTAPPSKVATSFGAQRRV
jgi:predicted transcriptional regulator of viral defense system